MLVTGKVTDALTAGQQVVDEQLEAAEKELTRIEKEEVRLKDEIAAAKKTEQAQNNGREDRR